MLHRTAESFYWMGRYTERVDHIARLIDANYHSHHRLTEKENNQECLQKRLLAILGDVPFMEEQKTSLQGNSILQFMTFDRTYENSILSCLGKARHNVRLVREQIPCKMWDTMNSFYLWLTEQDRHHGRDQSLFSFYEQIQQRVALFYGMTDSIMPRENEWNFIQAGRSLERVNNTIHTLQIFCNTLVEEENRGCNQDNYYSLISLLECVDGVETFRKFYANRVKLEEVMEFLVLNIVFPRSISFCFTELEMYLKAIQYEYRLESITKVIRLTARIKANFLTFLNLEGATLDQLQSFLNELLINCNQLGMEIEKCFFYEKEEELAEGLLQRKVAFI